MRNFLSTTFKVFSRSLMITAISFFWFQNVYAAPTISEFTANGQEDTLQVNDGQGWTLRWQGSNTGGCLVSTNEIAQGSSIPSWSVGGFENFDDPGALFAKKEELIYTFTCYEKVEVYDVDPEGIGGIILIRTATSGNPYIGSASPGAGLRISGDGARVSKTITVSVVDQSEESCPSGPDGEICRKVCDGHARTPMCNSCKGPNGTESPQCQQTYQCIKDNPDNTSQCYISNEQANQTALAQKKEECDIYSSTWGKCLIDAGIYIIDHTAIPFFAAFLSLCAMLFEIVVYVGIVKFSVIVGPESGGWITTIWGTIRDILNIGVIFVLLYAAINIIVGRGGEIKKLIAGVILFGVLTNFSLFFTKAAVDLSNVVALEFYNQMRGPDTTINEPSFLQGVGATVVNTTGLIRFYDTENLTGKEDDRIGKGSPLDDSFLYRFAMIVVMIAVSFIFLQAAFIFLGRTVSLIFLLIFSPLMFAGGVFAPLQKWIKKWHEEFIGQTILAPVFFILLYVAITILASLKVALEEQLKVIEGGSGELWISVGLIILTAGLTIFSFSLALNKAKEMAGSIGGKAASLGNKLGGFALGKATGGAAGLTARLGQQTLGRLGNKIDQGTGLMARTGQLLRLNKMKDASFDVRNTTSAAKVGQGITKILSTATGAPVTINTGQGLKGRETRMKEGVELAQKKADTEIDTELKKIDEGTKQYDIFDTKIVDNTGNELVRTNENNDEWEKKVNIANKYEKGQALAKKNTYLASHPVVGKKTSQLKTTTQKAQFKAVKAQQKKLSSETKKEQDHQIRKDKLKAYKDDLKTQFASDASTPLRPPLDGVRVSKSKSEIDAMGDEEVIALWDEIANTVSTEMKLYKADKKSVIDNPNQHSIADQREVFRVISDFEKLQKRAGGAGKDIESLKKAIESHEQKK